jgi:hypothetical protein
VTVSRVPFGCVDTNVVVISMGVLEVVKVSSVSEGSTAVSLERHQSHSKRGHPDAHWT